MTRRESLRIRRQSEKAKAGRERERAAAVDALPCVGSQIDVWFQVGDDAIWWKATVVEIKLPEQYPVCSGKPSVGDRIDVDRGDGVYTPGVVEHNGQDVGDAIVRLTTEEKDIAVMEVSKWRYSDAVKPRHDEMVVAEGRLLYDAIPERNYPCVSYEHVKFLMGSKLMSGGQPPTQWRRSNREVVDYEAVGVEHHVESDGESEAMSPQKKKPKVESVLDSNTYSGMEKRLRTLESIILSGSGGDHRMVYDGKVPIEPALTSTGPVLLMLLRRSVEKAVEQANRVTLSNSGTDFPHSEVDGACTSGTVVSGPVHIPASLSTTVFREMLKGTTELYAGCYYKVYPGLHEAVSGTGAEAVNITCSSFAAVSDLLGLPHPWRMESLLHRRKPGAAVEEEEGGVISGNRPRRPLFLRLLGALLCTETTNGDPSSVAIGSSSFCVSGAKSNTWCLVRKNSSAVQGQYVHGMELKKCPSICAVHRRPDGDASREGWKGDGKKSFRIEWQPTTHKKRGQTGDVLWGTFRIHIPYVVFRGFGEPWRIDKLISEDLVKDVVGYNFSDKRAEEYIK